MVIGNVSSVLVSCSQVVPAASSNPRVHKVTVPSFTPPSTGQPGNGQLPNGHAVSSSSQVNASTGQLPSTGQSVLSDPLSSRQVADRVKVSNYRDESDDVSILNIFSDVLVENLIKRLIFKIFKHYEYLFKIALST